MVGRRTRQGFGGRITIVGVLFFLIGGIVIARLFVLQVMRGDVFTALAQDQHSFEQIVIPTRGSIYVADRSEGGAALRPLAVNREWWMVYAVPRDIEDPAAAASRVAGVIGGNAEEIRARIDRPTDPYEPVAHRVDDETAERVRALGIKGIGTRRERLRYYPEPASLFAHVLGFLGFRGDDRVGQYGVEGFHEQTLAGMSGLVQGERSVRGVPIIFGDVVVREARDGSDAVLSLDPNIQFFAAEKLREAVKRLQAKSGSVIVMDPRTGDILALAAEPSFDPNAYGEVRNIDRFINPVVSQRFEPGSSFKPITMAAVIEGGAVSPATTYTDTGIVRFGSSTIRNFDGKAHGVRTMTEVLELSLNTGVAFAQQRLGNSEFRRRVREFRFQEKTGVDLEGEAAGNLSNLDHDRDIEFATASFGQGIAITPLGLARAYAAIANGGTLVRPRVVGAFIQPDGSQEEVPVAEQGRVISAATASAVTSMLVSTVDNRFDKKAKIPGYAVAGKTGTAQIPDPETGGYLEDETIHTFAGFAPAFDPKFVMVMTVERPKTIRFAADSIAPVWGDIAKFMLQYFEIPPER